jgi:glycerol-3-phosphate acyltransferase PlsY
MECKIKKGACICSVEWVKSDKGIESMNWPDIFYSILPASMGYLIGSFLPGYFLPLWVKKMDIRKVGDGNPGIINVRRNAGFTLAVLTCLYDLPKGLLCVFISLYLFKLPVSLAYLAGVSAIIGHKFPFYLGFKGGRGIAATVGLFLYIFIRILVLDFTWGEIIPFFIFIAIYALLLTLSTHGKGDLFTVSIFPFMGIYMLIHLHLSADLIFFLALAMIMTAESGRNLGRDKSILSRDKPAGWRTVARPFALLFIPLGLALQRSTLLILIGCVLALFFLLDLFRILIPKVESLSQVELLPGFRLCNKEEQGKISSMTDFLLGLFLCFLLFDRNIAFASLGFVSLAAWLAELVEVNFGKRRIFAQSERTLEGSLAFVSGAVTVAYFLLSGGLVPLHVAGIGALAALIIAVIPNRVDETFAIPLISGAIMSLL